MKTKRKLRLYGKEKAKLPKPISAKRDNGISLRQIGEADGRFAVIKTMRKRLETLKADVGIMTLQKEILCARAVFIVGHIETMETDALDGIELDWKKYLAYTRSLTDVLSKLGLEREVLGAQRLSDYVAESKGRA